MPQTVQIIEAAANGGAAYFVGCLAQKAGAALTQADISDSSFSRVTVEGLGAGGGVFYFVGRGRTWGSVRGWVGSDNVGNVPGDQRARPTVGVLRR